MKTGFTTIVLALALMFAFVSHASAQTNYPDPDDGLPPFTIIVPEVTMTTEDGQDCDEDAQNSGVTVFQKENTPDQVWVSAFTPIQHIFITLFFSSSTGTGNLPHEINIHTTCIEMG